MGNCCKAYADELSIEGSPRERSSAYSDGNPRENYRDENPRERLAMYGYGYPKEGSSTYSHGNQRERPPTYSHEYLREMLSSSKGPSRKTSSDLRVGRATSLDKGKGSMVEDQSDSSNGRPLLIDKQANRYIPLHAGDVGTSRQKADYDYPGAGRVSEALKGEQIAAGWPNWFAEVGGQAINGWLPKNPDTYEKLEKIGQGTYSTVYRALDLEEGKIVALKKVKFDSYEPDSVRFMAREIHILRRLDHPNVIKLEGLVISRTSCSLYLVFEYMEHDLAGLISCSSFKFSEPQIKCYMRQLLCGLDYCHHRGILHRDIKGANLLVDDKGNLKIADFGLACFYIRSESNRMTNHVVTLWYRSPEIILGATNYGIGVDLWSAGCVLAELYAGKPIMCGNTELEQLQLIFELCGSPPEENYWANPLLPYAKALRPRPPYKRRITEVFQYFPSPAARLIDTLLSIHPYARKTASHALHSEFFSSYPFPCGPAELPRYPPKQAIDAIIRNEEALRRIAEKNKGNRYDAEGSERTKYQANPQPDANAKFVFPIKKLEDQFSYPQQEEACFPVIPPRPKAEDVKISCPEGTSHRRATNSGAPLHQAAWTNVVKDVTAADKISSRTDFSTTSISSFEPHKSLMINEDFSLNYGYPQQAVPKTTSRLQGSFHEASSSMKNLDDNNHKERIAGFVNQDWRLYRDADYTNYVSKDSGIRCSESFLPSAGRLEHMLKDHHPYVQEAIRHARDEKAKREVVDLPTNALFIGPGAAKSYNSKKG